MARIWQSAFQLGKNECVLTIENRLSFPKLQFKSGLSLLIIKIIALEDMQYRPKKTETVIEIELKPKKLLPLESSK